MMTGNSVSLAQLIAEKCWHDANVFFLLIVTYVSGMLIYRSIDYLIREKFPDCSVGPATVVGVFLLVCFVFADLSYVWGDGPDNYGGDYFTCGIKHGNQQTPIDPTLTMPCPAQHGVWGLLLIAAPMVSCPHCYAGRHMHVCFSMDTQSVC